MSVAFWIIALDISLKYTLPKFKVHLTDVALAGRSMLGALSKALFAGSRMPGRLSGSLATVLPSNPSDRAHDASPAKPNPLTAAQPILWRDQRLGYQGADYRLGDYSKRRGASAIAARA